LKNVSNDENNLKTSVSYDVISEKQTILLSILNPSNPANPNQIIRSKIISSSYTKNIDVIAILHDTQPVGTVIQKSLNVPEGQMSALHSQA
jgi:hypothetical protein